MSSRIPHPANVAGDFYVEDGCCISCMIPHKVAPDLMSMTEHHCFVCKQPETPEELDRMFQAFEVQDVDCIRYRGTDQFIQLRLINASAGDQCDELAGDLATYKHYRSTPASSRLLASSADEQVANARDPAVAGNIWAALKSWLNKKS